MSTSRSTSSHNLLDRTILSIDQELVLLDVFLLPTCHSSSNSSKDSHDLLGRAILPIDKVILLLIFILLPSYNHNNNDDHHIFDSSILSLY